MNREEVTSPESILKNPITYLRRPITRSTSSKQPKAPTTLQQKGKWKLQEKQGLL